MSASADAASPGPTPHPPPPANLAARALPIKTLADPLVRMYSLGKAPKFFGRLVRYRFDAPRREFGTMYAGNDEFCAFIETYGDQLEPYRLLTQTELDKKGLAEVRPRRPLQLVDLTGEGLAQVGADARIAAGDDYALSRQWSLAFHEHPERIDGLWYRSRHDPARLSAALFDRVSPAIQVIARGALMDTARRALVGRLTNTYRFGIIP